MADKLLVQVPRHTEQEPGYRSTEMFGQGSDLTISTDDSGRAEAFLDPISRRWMGQPVAPLSTLDTDDFTATGTTAANMLSNSLGGSGVECTTEAVDPLSPWSLQMDADLQVARGFYLDFSLWEPTDFDLDTTTAACSIRWDRWRLDVRGGEQGQPMAQLYELKSGTAATWTLRAITPLLVNKLYNQPHSLWVQPLDGDEFLLANRGRADVGLVVRTETPYAYDADAAAPDEDHSPDQTTAPWGPGKLTIFGVTRGFFIFRYTQSAANWTVETNGTRTLGYDCTQDVTKIVDAWLPQEDDRYSATLAVYEGDPNADPVPDEWAADAGGQDTYAWRLTVAGPDDSGDGYSYRIPVLAKLQLEWPPTTDLSSSTPTDLLDTGTANVNVLGLSMTRTVDDRNSIMAVQLGGELATIAAWIRPYTRWQWQVDQGGGAYYVAFDGLLVDPEGDVLVLVDGTYRIKLQITLRSRWAQADEVLFRGGIALDGYKRSEAYEILAKQFPLDVDGSPAELSYVLADDRPVPAARRGQKPAFQPRIGTQLSEVFFDLQKCLGPDDRLAFRDNGDDGSGGRAVALKIDQPSATSQATFYRTAAEAETAGAPKQVMSAAPGNSAFSYRLSAREFYNEIYVVGQSPPLASDRAKGDGPQPGQLLASYYALPDSWQNDATGLQIGIRKTLIVVRPELQTQADVDAVCRALVEQVVRFQTGMRMRSFFVEDLLPGDLIETDPGDEPSGTTRTWRITGMTVTEMRNQSVDADRRYPCVYELAEVVA